MKHLIFLLFITLSTSAFAQDAKEAAPPPAQEKAATTPQFTGNVKDTVQVGDVYQACKYYFSKMFNTRENSSRKSICNGYFFGSTSVLLLLQSEGIKTNTCIPMDVSTEDMVTQFLEWVDKNPDTVNLLVSEGMLKMVRQTYPCMEYKKPGEKN